MSDNKDATQPFSKLDMPNMNFNQHFSNDVVAKAFEEAIFAEIKREREELEALEAADRDMPTLVDADGDEFFEGDFVKLDLDDDKHLKERDKKTTKLEQQVKVGIQIFMGKQAALEEKDMALEAMEKKIKAREKFAIEKGIALQEQKIALEEKDKDLQAREKILVEKEKTFEKENRMLNVRLEALDCKEDAVIKKLDYCLRREKELEKKG